MHEVDNTYNANINIRLSPWITTTFKRLIYTEEYKRCFNSEFLG